MRYPAAPRRPTPITRLTTGALWVAGLVCVAGCTEIPRGSAARNDLSALRKVSVEITGRTQYTAYVADNDESRALGLMNVTEAELPEDHGMIFVFPFDWTRSFWMRNTVMALDIAYIRSDGTIVKTHTMEPFRESGYPSIEPARFALEVRAGQFAQWGVVEGDHVEIPDELFD